MGVMHLCGLSSSPVVLAASTIYPLQFRVDVRRHASTDSSIIALSVAKQSCAGNSSTDSQITEL